MKVTKKVKSMQMFRKPVTSIIQVFCHLFSFKFVIKWKYDDIQILFCIMGSEKPYYVNLTIANNRETGLECV